MTSVQNLDFDKLLLGSSGRTSTQAWMRDQDDDLARSRLAQHLFTPWTQCSLLSSLPAS